jgi:hypothetical protein
LSGAAPAGTDRQSAIAWSRYSVSRALGEVSFFERVDDPTYYGDIYSAAVALPALALLAGDSTFDNLTGLHWYTNGLTLVAQPTPAFPATAPAPAPFPISAGVIGALGGPISGIAMNAGANILWMCSSASRLIVGVTPIPGTPVVVAPFAVPAGTAPLTGLEWDSMSGSLFVVESSGLIQNIAPGGALLAPLVMPVVGFPGPVADVAIDKTGRLNVFGQRPLYVVGVAGIRDVTNPAATVMPGATFGSVGLAFQNHPAANPASGTCLCPGTAYPTQGTSGPMTAGFGGFALGLGGLPPGMPVVFAFDTSIGPLVPLTASGCGVGLVLGSPTLVSALGIANAAGNAVLPVPLLVPPGTGPVYNQNVTFCPGDPSGLIFSPLRQLYASGI